MFEKKSAHRPMNREASASQLGAAFTSRQAGLIQSDKPRRQRFRMAPQDPALFVSENAPPGMAIHQNCGIEKPPRRIGRHCLESYPEIASGSLSLLARSDKFAQYARRISYDVALQIRSAGDIEDEDAHLARFCQRERLTDEIQSRRERPGSPATGQ